MVGKAIADVAKLALFDILFDWVQWFFFANLYQILISSSSKPFICLDGRP